VNEEKKRVIRNYWNYQGGRNYMSPDVKCFVHPDKEGVLYFEDEWLCEICKLKKMKELREGKQ